MKNSNTTNELLVSHFKFHKRNRKQCVCCIVLRCCASCQSQNKFLLPKREYDEKYENALISRCFVSHLTKMYASYFLLNHILCTKTSAQHQFFISIKYINKKHFVLEKLFSLSLKGSYIFKNNNNKIVCSIYFEILFFHLIVYFSFFVSLQVFRRCVVKYAFGELVTSKRDYFMCLDLYNIFIEKWMTHNQHNNPKKLVSLF